MPHAAMCDLRIDGGKLDDNSETYGTAIKRRSNQRNYLRPLAQWRERTDPGGWGATHFHFSVRLEANVGSEAPNTPDGRFRSGIWGFVQVRWVDLASLQPLSGGRKLEISSAPTLTLSEQERSAG